MASRFLLVVLVSMLLGSCLEPIDGVFGDYENLLVVDGLVTNESKPYSISISRTIKNIGEVPEKVERATVTVEDDLGGVHAFHEAEPGKYLSDPAQFTGVVGRSYRLSVKTKQGEQYLSDWCELLPAGVIDSVYLGTEVYKSTVLDMNVDGVGIFVDGTGVAGMDNYFRWTFEEDWKFKVSYPKYVVVHEDNSLEIVPPVNYICWKSNVYSGIMVQSDKGLASERIDRKRITGLHPADDDRVSIRYSILVKQLSISQKEYTFWKNLAQSDQQTWDLFGKQPYAVVGNINNVKDSKEPVLGYFQVASVASKRIYINDSDVGKLGVRNYYNFSVCALDTVLLDEENCCLYDIYEEKTIKGNSGLVTPVYDLFTGEVLGLVFSSRYCTDCTMTGKKNPPAFWEE